MKVETAEFITGAVHPRQYPPPRQMEFAFAGRSNVGKSSLLNSLLNRKKLVKTSSTPGKTQMLNFFNINNRFIFTDLPGYGFAKVSKEVTQGWQKMVEHYLLRRENLHAVVLLIDIRREPLALDLDMKTWLDSIGLDCILVATKSDKLSANELQRQASALQRAFGASADNPLILYSSKTHSGRDKLWQAILRIANSGGQKSKKAGTGKIPHSGPKSAND